MKSKDRRGAGGVSVDLSRPNFFLFVCWYDHFWGTILAKKTRGISEREKIEYLRGATGSYSIKVHEVFMGVSDWRCMGESDKVAGE